MTNKSQDAYKTIGEVAEILNLFNTKTNYKVDPITNNIVNMSIS